VKKEKEGTFVALPLIITSKDKGTFIENYSVPGPVIIAISLTMPSYLRLKTTL
jgi:hypothetical protein